MDFSQYLLKLNRKFPDFNSFRGHVTKILQSRDQIKADYDRLPSNYTKAGVLFCLIIPKTVQFNNLVVGQSVVDHVYILLEKRSEDLKNHPGQMAFPGGTKEEEDKNIIETAYREANEEVGIETENLKFVEYLDEFISSSSILVKPVISWLFLDYPLDDFITKIQNKYNPKTEESEATVVVPLTHLLNPENYHSRPYRRNGKLSGHVRFFNVDKYFENDHIWGLTASMIKRFLDEVFPDNLLEEGEFSEENVLDF